MNELLSLFRAVDESTQLSAPLADDTFEDTRPDCTHCWTLHPPAPIVDIDLKALEDQAFDKYDAEASMHNKRHGRAFTGSQCLKQVPIMLGLNRVRCDYSTVRMQKEWNDLPTCSWMRVLGSLLEHEGPKLEIRTVNEPWRWVEHAEGGTDDDADLCPCDVEGL
jgi:hypothetical protein